jgi:outer membrane protein TolC
MSLAHQLRAEGRAASARLDAARQRPAIVSALDDPVIAPSIDHKPADPMMKTDRSITLEQSFPLSAIRSHRRRAAEADIGKVQGEAGRTALKVEAEVAQAFFMLEERRRTRHTLERQTVLAADLVKLAAARHAVGSAQQADVLRAEIELARLRARLAATSAQVRSAEAMFNTALGRSADEPIPALLTDGVYQQMARVPELAAALETALARRPEVRISKAEIERAKAEVDVMKSMYKPMAMVRVGKADTMSAGRGYMLMVAVSVPIWFDRLRAGVREAGAMSAMAQADREAMLRMIEGDVAASIASLRGAAASYQAFQSDLIPRAERAMAPAMAAYASGTLPLASVLETSRVLWSVQEEAVMLEAALGAAWTRHRSAIGFFGDAR